MLSIEMDLGVKFNRMVNEQKDYIIPGGFEMVMNDRSVQFDFCTSHNEVSPDNPEMVNFTLKDADCSAFPDFAKVTADDLRNISSITDCFVYTGEDEETDLELVSIIGLKFLVLSPSDAVEIVVPDQVIKNYNEQLKSERAKRQKQLFKQKPELFAKKAVSRGPEFLSRFLDMSITDLIEYDYEKLVEMVKDIACQMPEDIFEQFIIELNGGKRSF